MKTLPMTLSARRTRAMRMITQLKVLYPTVKSALTFSQPYEFLFAVIMSAQTTDLQVNKVTEKLFKKYPRLEDYISADPAQFEKDISSIGLYKAKARNILTTAKILRDHFEGKVPRTVAEIITLPGAGRKTANVVLGHLYGISEGIAVDTHMIRLCQKYGLTKEKDPAKIEKDLMQIIPKEEWIGFTNRMIWYGREYCPAYCKKCPSCPLWKASSEYHYG